ncbi:uncharacterized protein LOC132393598 [Hypanus sabinus]|uniref:uncharacterized protein LOC132393598 n=1 Tax=Hypanus sabinus TaxID=79690 RepID=UPI0028C38FD0|nr:uncharacterized protein LOC132393598 [Hypanus sabinus]
MSAQSSIKSTPPSDKGSKPTSSKPTQALSGVPSAAMSARSGIKSMAPSDKGSRTTSSKSTQARAKAEAAKVRLHYAKQEAVLKMKLATKEAERAARQREEAAREVEIQKERAAREAETQLEMTKISTELHVLQLEGEGEAARMEAEYIEEAEGSRDLTETSSALERTRLERTSDYVQYQADRQARLPSPYLFDNFPSYEEENLPSRPRDEVKNERADNRYTLTPKLQSSMRRDAEVESRMANSMRNVRSQSYRRQRTSPARTPLAADPTLQYLARRDLVTSGLYQFDDKPENYRAWLSTFTNVIDGVQLSATQRLDLMAKWLGKESRDQVRRMRSVYINKPELALSEAWERLWERYGAPDIIEAALYRRLGNFPKVSAKDHFKLREFGDLLMEIQGAKEDGYSAGLVVKERALCGIQHATFTNYKHYYTTAPDASHTPSEQILYSHTASWPSQQRVERGAECVSLLLPVQSLSTTKTPAVPPQGHTRKLGILQSQAKLQGISEQQWAPEMWRAGPPLCGYALAPVNHCPSYG